MMPSLDEKLDLLKNKIQSLREWSHLREDLDGTKARTVMSVQELLDSLRDYPLAAVEWSYGTVLVMHLRQEDILDSSHLLKDVSTKFVENIHLIDKSQTIMHIWNFFRKSNCLLQFLIPHPEMDLTCFIKFVKKCFNSLPTAASAVQDIFISGTVACILGLIEKSSYLLHKILNIMFMELMKPSSLLSKRAVQNVLKSCGWKISDSIQNMLNPIFHQHTSPYSSHDHVYKIVFELVSIDKCLVVGVINNTELCFESGREDHEAGLEFLCKLFGSKSIGGTVFYSTLWNRFLSHCRDIIVCRSQLLILGKHTCSILGQPSAHKDWCSLLTFFFEHVLHSAVERCFLTGMIDALNLYYLEDIDPLMDLFKKLLTSYSVYERGGQVREELILMLAKAYKEIARVGVINLTLLKNHERSAQLISCFRDTLCNLFHPPNARWFLLRKVFVKYLVPFDFPPEMRMKMLLYLWINSQGEWDVFHELFLKLNRSRSTVNNILYIMKDETTFARNKHLLSKKMCDLDFYLSHNEYGKRELGKALAETPKLRKMLTYLLAENVSCENALIYADAARHYFLPNDVSSEIVDDLLSYLRECTVDEIALKHLVTLVKSCIEDREFSVSMNLNRLHIAKTALHLLNEILAMLPYLGYDTVILNQILEWANSKHSCLSMLSVRCLSSIAYTRTLDSWNQDYFRKIVTPVIFNLVKDGSEGQVKVAIECLDKHASLKTYRPQLLNQLLDTISTQVNSERGMNALGYFSSVTLSDPFKMKVENLCMSHLVHYITAGSDQETMPLSSNSSWVDREDLRPEIRIVVQAIRSIGRCMRYCGYSCNVKYILSLLQKIICSRKECVRGNIRDVDTDHLKYEAACAVLNILETEENHHFISKQLLIDLSCMITHSREEVRVGFAKKICQGLSPHKILSNIRGHRRGNLPTCMLGILALLGSHWWSYSSEARNLAEFLLQGVFASRQMDRMKKMASSKVTYEQLYQQYPHLIYENILVIALPILAERNDFHISEDFKNIDALKNMAVCLDFVRAMLCHSNILGGQVTKEYMINLVEFSRISIDLPSSQSLKRKYLSLFDLLPTVVKRYKSSEILEVVTPPVMLPPPFFHGDREHTPDLDQTILPRRVLNSIEKSLRVKSPDVREDELEISEDDEDSSRTAENSAIINFQETNLNSTLESLASFSRDFSSTVHSTPVPSTRNAKKRRLE